jgi:hypothetical protein
LLVERIAHGIFRLRRFPAQGFEDVIVACLWADDGADASHDTALAVYELTDAMAVRVHVTVPRAFRGQRNGVVVHVAPLDETDAALRTALEDRLRRLLPICYPWIGDFAVSPRILVPRQGLEPRTVGLRGRCSAN